MFLLHCRFCIYLCVIGSGSSSRMSTNRECNSKESNNIRIIKMLLECIHCFVAAAQGPVGFFCDCQSPVEKLYYKLVLPAWFICSSCCCGIILNYHLMGYGCPTTLSDNCRWKYCCDPATYLSSPVLWKRAVEAFLWPHRCATIML